MVLHSALYSYDSTKINLSLEPKLETKQMPRKSIQASLAQIP